MAWKVERENVPMQYKDGQAQRLTDLALAMVIPWMDGYPQYWVQEDNREQRERQIYEATKGHRLPWL